MKSIADPGLTGCYLGVVTYPVDTQHREVVVSGVLETETGIVTKILIDTQVGIMSNTQEKPVKLHKCRDLMLDELSRRLNVMLDKADDFLFNLVQKSGPAEHGFYFDAMREVRLKRTSMQTGFRDQLSRAFEDYAKPAPVSALSRDEARSDIEEKLAVTSTLEKINANCHALLLSLDQRMMEALNGTDDGNRINPVRPETICNAFQLACEAVDTDIEIKLILYKLFEKYVTRDLGSLYQSIDELLAGENENLPEREHTYYEITEDNTEEKPADGKAETRDKNFYIIANRIIRNEIYLHMGEGVLPSFVQDFILVHWSKLLLKIYIKQGTESNAWIHAIEVITDLVNCIGNKSSITEKMMLADVMPNLVQRLKYGMNVIPVKPVVRKEFISELLAYHNKLMTDAGNAKNSGKLKGYSSEDITLPSFRTSGAKLPFSDELLAENRTQKKTDLDI